MTYDWKLLFLGMLGGLLSELIRAKKAYDDGKSWTMGASISLALALALVLGAVAVLIQTQTLNTPLLALAAGFTAPATITGLLGGKGGGGGPPSLDGTGSTPSLRQWWSY